MSATSARFSISDALSDGWRAFTANIAPMALYALVVVVVTGVVNLLTPGPTESSVLTFVANVVVFLVNQVITIGWLRIALDAVDGRPVSAERVRASFEVLVPFAVAAVLFSLAVGIGLLLLVVPGIIIAIALGFYGWLLVDGREHDAVGALRRSAELTAGERLHLFGFGVVLLLFNVVGVLLLVVGVIVTSAVSILATASVYRSLAGPREADEAAGQQVA